MDKNNVIKNNDKGFSKLRRKISVCFCLLFILMGNEQCRHLIFVLLIIFRKCGCSFEKLLAVKAFSVNQSLVWGKKKPTQKATLHVAVNGNLDLLSPSLQANRISCH